MPEKSAYNAHSSQPPRIVFINYANDKYKYQQRFVLMAAKKFGGFSEVIAYSPASIDENFRKANKELLNIPRGNGLWIWKPYVILDALGRVSDGDYVFYCDSGAFVFRNVLPVIEGMNDCDIWASNTEFIDEQWTKPEVFTRLGITDSGITSSNQICASYVIARKSAMSLEFVREWLRLCTVPELIKTLKGIKPAPQSDWSKAKSANLTYTDTYEPFIFHHRIRTARSMTEFILKLFAGMGLKRAAKIFMYRRVV